MVGLNVYKPMVKGQSPLMRKGAPFDEIICGLSQTMVRVSFKTQQEADDFKEKYDLVGYLCVKCREKPTNIYHDEDVKSHAISCPVCGEYFREKEPCLFEDFYANGMV